jgi:hypothetical protein
MNHLTVGALIPFVIGCVLYVKRGFRAGAGMLTCVPLAMFLCATWAVLPDLPRTFGLAGYDPGISANPRIDVFFWHYTLNLHETDNPVFTVVFVGMALCLFAAAWRELYLGEKG